jgi:hypothetical protein
VDVKFISNVEFAGYIIRSVVAEANRGFILGQSIDLSQFGFVSDRIPTIYSEAFNF